jgi:hypothetical protein
MAPKKTPTAVITPDGESLIISVPNELRNKIKISGKGPLDTAIIAKAEAAIKELSVEFDGWMKTEIKALMAAHQDVLTHGLIEPYGKKLHLVAHDMRGQAETLGYPLVGRYCASICKMFDAVTDFGKIPLHAIGSHIGAISAAMRDTIKDDEDAMANAVLNKLENEVADFYDHHKDLQAQEAEKAQDDAADATKTEISIEELAQASGAIIVGKTRQTV